MSDTSLIGELYLGDGVIANGEAIVPAKAILNGRFDGLLNASEIDVQAQAIVSGTIRADVITVAGELRRSFQATDTLSIKSSGVVKGTIRYGKLEMAKGGELVGKIIKI